MIGRIFSVSALLASFAILCLGHGLQSILLPSRGAMFENYPNLTTGAMMSAYYVGFISGTFLCPYLISRIGHIRVFAAAAACASTIMLCHSLFPNQLAWVALRLIYGFCFIHLFTVMESWLNSIGEAGTRGRILSIYMIVNFLAMSGGQMLFFSAPVTGFELFAICAIMLSFSLVPLMVSRSIQPNLVQPPEFFGIRKLFRVSPLGVAGALTAGMMGGAYWGLTAVFILNMGYTQDAVAWFMSASLIGGLVAQWPLGMLSDRINRRYVIMLASVLIGTMATIVSLMALTTSPAETFGLYWLVTIGAIFGMGFHPLYSLCMAHANDFVGPENFVRASSGLQLVQGTGAVIGPLAAGFLMYLGGAVMLYIYIAAMAIIFSFYILKRLNENRIPPQDRVMPFSFLSPGGILALFMPSRYRDK